MGRPDPSSAHLATSSAHQPQHSCTRTPPFHARPHPILFHAHPHPSYLRCAHNLPTLHVCPPHHAAMQNYVARAQGVAAVMSAALKLAPLQQVQGDRAAQGGSEWTVVGCRGQSCIN